MRRFSLALTSLTLILPCASVAFAAPPLAIGSDPAPRSWVQPYVVSARWQVNTVGNELFGNNPQFNAESDLGLSRRGAYLGLALGRRIGERWRVELDYGEGRRSGERTLGADLDADGKRYSAGTRLESTSILRHLQVTGGWALVQSNSVEAGLLVGGRLTQLSRSLSGQGRPLPDFGEAPQAGPDTGIASNAADSGLLPVAGVFASTRVATDWSIDGRLSLTSRSNMHWQVQAVWSFSPNGSLSAGFFESRQNIDGVSCFIVCTARQLIDTRVRGPQVAVALAF